MDEREKRLAERFQEHWSHIPICGEQARLEEYHKWLKAECLRLMAEREKLLKIAKQGGPVNADDLAVLKAAGLPTEGGKE